MFNDAWPLRWNNNVTSSSSLCEQSPISTIDGYRRQTRICYCNEIDVCNQQQASIIVYVKERTYHDRNTIIVAIIILTSIVVLSIIIVSVWCNDFRRRRCRSSTYRCSHNRRRPYWVNGVFSSTSERRQNTIDQSTTMTCIFNNQLYDDTILSSNIPYTMLIQSS